MNAVRSISILIAALMGISAPISAQSVVATNTVQSFSANDFAGQSFTVTGSGSFNNASFSFLNNSATVANGNLYLYTIAQSVAPTSLAGTTQNRLGVASASNGTYSFGSGVFLNAGTKYFAYSDTQQTVGVSQETNYSGGDLYNAESSTSGYYVGSANYDRSFVVRATQAATPEPATWSLMILGFGIVGGTLRRQKRQRGSTRVAT